MEPPWVFDEDEEPLRQHEKAVLQAARAGFKFKHDPVKVEKLVADISGRMALLPAKQQFSETFARKVIKSVKIPDSVGAAILSDDRVVIPSFMSGMHNEDKSPAAEYCFLRQKIATLKVLIRRDPWFARSCLLHLIAETKQRFRAERWVKDLDLELTDPERLEMATSAANADVLQWLLSPLKELAAYEVREYSHRATERAADTAAALEASGVKYSRIVRCVCEDTEFRDFLGDKKYCPAYMAWKVGSQTAHRLSEYFGPVSSATNAASGHDL